jgi:hypothetical protein
VHCQAGCCEGRIDENVPSTHEGKVTNAARKGGLTHAIKKEAASLQIQGRYVYD